jgi:hypothetical protein
MQVQALITALDEEIARLRQARELLGGAGEVKRRGRPKGSTNKPAGKAKTARASVSTASAKPKRQMSPEGKARIAAAQKARWAAQKGTSTIAKKTRGTAAATRSKPPATLDRRTRAGKAAAKAAAGSKGKASTKRASAGKVSPAAAPAASSEVTAQA